MSNQIKFKRGEIIPFTDDLLTIILYDKNNKRVYMGNIIKEELEVIIELHPSIINKSHETK